ncbi:MAG: acyl-ACP desaturase [Mycobacteriaceae bacterium]|nr:acyl-ACP desaturase [Mycobacteriaceae bacterium]
MHNHKTDRDLLDALSFEVELNVRRHVAEAAQWQPHDLVPWSDGRNFAFLGGEDWTPEQSKLDESTKLALTVSLLLADNLPAYHRELAAYLLREPWFGWVGRWTAEENRHAIVIRNYLMATRAVDPVELERVRMAHMTAGLAKPAMGLLEILVEAAFDETASAVLHRNIAAATSDPAVAAICERIAADDELQAVFFANLVTGAFEVAPDQALQAIADRVAGWRMPTVELPGRDSAAELAAAGLYAPERTSELVFAPLLHRWRVADRTAAV